MNKFRNTYPVHKLNVNHVVKVKTQRKSVHRSGLAKKNRLDSNFNIKPALYMLQVRVIHYLLDSLQVFPFLQLVMYVVSIELWSWRLSGRTNSITIIRA